MLKKMTVTLMGTALLLLSACGSSEPTATEVPTAAPVVAAPVATATPLTDAPSGAAGSPLTTTDRGPLDSPLGAPNIDSTKAATLIREAQVETVTVQISDTVPVQVRALVSGILGDGCTELSESTQRREDNTFYITLQTTRPADAMCTQVARNYEEAVTLETTDVAAGDYIVSANGVTTTFTLP